MRQQIPEILWRPSDVVDDIPFTDAAPDHVPTLDQDAPVATYQDWTDEDTRIVTCRIGNDIYPGERYETRDEARAATELKYGRILVANYVQGRAFFRVFKTRTAKDILPPPRPALYKDMGPGWEAP